MEAHLHEWLNLSIRWVHMITGIAWIGASFYFVWLENNLNRSNPREGLSGDLWAIHGGGIYHLEKYKLAPPKMPENLHWFKWEAYFTGCPVSPCSAWCSTGTRASTCWHRAAP